MIFPILSTVFGLLAVIATVVPAALARGVFDGGPVDEHDPVLIATGLAAAAVKARWGEGATGAATIGLATFLISLAIALVGGTKAPVFELDLAGPVRVV